MRLGFPARLKNAMNIERFLLAHKAHAGGTQYLLRPTYLVNVDQALKWQAPYEQKLGEVSSRLSDIVVTGDRQSPSPRDGIESPHGDHLKHGGNRGMSAGLRSR